MHYALINHFLAVLDVDAVSGVDHLAAHEVVDGVVALSIGANGCDGRCHGLVQPKPCWLACSRAVLSMANLRPLLQGEHGGLVVLGVVVEVGALEHRLGASQYGCALEPSQQPALACCRHRWFPFPVAPECRLE